MPDIIEKLRAQNTIIQKDNFKIEEVNFEQNKLILMFTFTTGKKPEFSDVFTGFFEYINLSVPNHTSYISVPFYKYTLKSAPDGAYITRDGYIKWKPDISHLGYNTILFTVSDDYYSDEGKLSTYVNDVPKITSQPQKYANINEVYTYNILVEDQNKSDQIKFELVESTPDVNLDENGLLEWKVTSADEKDNYFKILISDSRDTVFHNFHVQINQKPIIQSDQNIAIKSGRLFEYSIQAYDPEGSSLHYTAVSIPESANFDHTKGILFWRPEKNSIGIHTIIIEVSDEEGNASIVEFQLQVVPSKITLKTLSILSGAIGLGTILLLLFV